MKRPAFSVGFLLAVFAVAGAGFLSTTPAASADAPLRPADLVLRGGSIWRGKDLPRATALAAIGEEIVATGSDADVSRWIGPATRVVDLAGRLVVPGFNDAHAHFLAGGHGLASVDLRPSTDEADMARRLGAYAKKLPKGEWITEGRWDHEAWPSKKLPTRNAIDAATPDNPVLVERIDGHMALANSRALALAGIDRSTPEPAGGTIVRDAAGDPTGILKDNALDLMTKAVSAPSHASNLEAARRALREAARVGVTSIQDSSDVAAIRVYLDLKARGELTVRLYAWRSGAVLADLVRAGIATGVGDDRLRLGAIKLYADGSLGAGTAAMFSPYADDPKTSGLLVHPDGELQALVLAADAGGWQLAVHAIGDRANGLVLDAFAKAAAMNAPRDRRFRVEHAQHVRLADLDRYKALGVVASIQPSHAIDDMRWAEKRIGKERLREAYNLRSFLAKGIPVAFGTDWFVEPLDPRLGLFAAVTRLSATDPSAPPFKPEERLTMAEALDLYTRGSAYAEFAEARKGTLEAGRLCDLVVFGQDLFELERKDPRGILTAPIEMTVMGGRVVFEAKR